jgi:hypothetical protein
MRQPFVFYFPRGQARTEYVHTTRPQPTTTQPQQQQTFTCIKLIIIIIIIQPTRQLLSFFFFDFISPRQKNEHHGEQGA